MSPRLREGSLEREAECEAGAAFPGAVLGTSEMPPPRRECRSRTGVMGRVTTVPSLSTGQLPVTGSHSKTLLRHLSIVSLHPGEGSYSPCTSVSPLGTGIVPVRVIAHRVGPRKWLRTGTALAG